MKLFDFARKILVLEWFAYWCPFCKQAAPEIEKLIEEYRAAGGNPDGIEVVEAGCNVQLESVSPTSQTDRFAKAYNFQLVLEDNNRALQKKFTSQSGQPTFVVINGIANPAVGRQWEEIYFRHGYGDTASGVASTVMAMRNAINAVRKTTVVEVPPRIRQVNRAPSGEIQLFIDGSPRDKIKVQGFLNLVIWEDSPNPVPTDPTNRFESPPRGRIGFTGPFGGHDKRPVGQ